MEIWQTQSGHTVIEIDMEAGVWRYAVDCRFGPPDRYWHKPDHMRWLHRDGWVHRLDADLILTEGL